MPGFIEYKVGLSTSLAKQLWNGRKANKKTFIPGILEFNERIVSLVKLNGGSGQKRISEIQESMKEVRAAMEEWRAELNTLPSELLPTNSEAVGIKLTKETKPVRFHQETTRQLALLIAQFDDLSCQAIIAEQLRQDLGLSFGLRPNEPTKRLSKKILAIIHSSRSPLE